MKYITDQLRDFNPQMMAEATGLTRYYDLICQRHSNTITPHFREELDELLEPERPEGTDSGELLVLCGELAAEFLECIRPV